MLSMRALVAAAAVSTMALTGCTAGYVTLPDGSDWVPNGTGQVAFTNLSTNVKYTVDVVPNNSGAYGLTTFSFDPNGPSSSTNNKTQIPAGNYVVVVNDSSSSYWSAPSGQVNVNYNTTCTDFYTNNSTPCDEFHLVVNPCGSTNSPGITMNGSVTVVQLFPVLCN